METGTAEAHHQLPVSSKGLREKNLLHPGSGRGRKVVCSIGWEERNKLHPRVLAIVNKVPKQKESKCNHESISKRGHRLVRLASIRKVKIARGSLEVQIKRT